MKRLLLNRLAWALPVIVLIVVVNFLLTRWVPGDPLIAILGEYPVPQEYADQVRRELRLDQPLGTQLIAYLGEVARGNLGYSFVTQQNVLSLVLGRAGKTLLLLIPAMALAVALGIGMAWMAVRRSGGPLNAALSGLTLFGYSMPSFWMGQILIIVFAVNLGLLPAQGMLSVRGVSGPWATLLDFGRHWILPGVCVATALAAVIARVARASLREALTLDHVSTARTKGLSERRVFWRHVLPNGLIPVVTVVGSSFGHALTGTIMVETVFAWPGLGSLFLNAISSRDYPVIQGIFLFSATAVVFVNLFTDLLYGYLDPRIAASYRGAR